MKTLRKALFITIASLSLASCQFLQNVEKKVEVVNDRNADGTYKATADVVNAAGEHAVAKGSLYVFPSGSFAVSATGTGSFDGNKITR